MGKKGSWFSAIKRFFVPHSKEKLNNESHKRSDKGKKKKGLGKLRHGETNSFLPFFREPSSIEEILGEAEQEHKSIFRPSTPPEHPRTPPFVPRGSASPLVSSQRIASPRVASPRAASPRAASPRAASPPPRAGSPRARTASPRAASPPPRAGSPRARTASPRAASPPPRAGSPRARTASPRAASPPPPPPPRLRASSPRAASPKAAPPRIVHPLPEPTLRNQHASATKIQAAYRGYKARRSFRALKGLVRLQGVVRGQNVRRQTMNAVKRMQLLVRVQSQIQSLRIQMLENQARRQAQFKNDKEAESTFSKWISQASEAGNENWDDSVLTKEEREARMRQKVEAAIKRERAMSYAYSHQLWKATPESAHAGVSDIRSGGFPWWWKWIDRHLPPVNAPESQRMRNFQLTPTRPNSEAKPSPRPRSSSSKQQQFTFDNIMDIPTPKSTRSTILPATRRIRMLPSSSSRTPQASSSGLSKYSRPRARGAASPFDLALRDTDSLTSCPPFSVPNYMTPTVSAMAKVRASSNPKERHTGTPGTPGSEASRRLSFPLTQGEIGSFKWGKDSSSQRGSSDKHQSLQSIGNLSVDSTVSTAATAGRKPFNRFV